MTFGLMMAVWSSNLPPVERLVAMYVADAIPGIDRDFTAWADFVPPRLEELAETVCLTPEETVAVLGRLEELGVADFSLGRWFLLPVLPERPATPPRPKLTPVQRARWLATLLVLQEMCCAYCRRPGGDSLDPDGRPWHIDRVIPGAAGGSYEAGNVVVACSLCNVSKGASIDPRWLSMAALSGALGVPV